MYCSHWLVVAVFAKGHEGCGDRRGGVDCGVCVGMALPGVHVSWMMNGAYSWESSGSALTSLPSG